MPSYKTSGVISAIAGAASVMAHGHVESIIADGVEYPAFSLSLAYQDDTPPVVGWATQALDNGFVLPEDFSSGDIVCHKQAEPAEGSAVVSAGGEIFLQWDTWPESHKGPIIDMLAPCGDDCSTVDKTSLEFFKIQEVGLVSGSGTEGTWASDQLIENGNGWLVQIPSTLAAGNYVLRHEIIAHHEGNQENGAQLYPQCINIQVTDGGSDLPEGTVATSFYDAQDPGILFDIYSNPSEYEIPGPAAPSIASVVEQRAVTAESEGEPVVGGGSGSGGNTTTPAPTEPETGDDEDESSTPEPSSPVEIPDEEVNQGNEEDDSTTPAPTQPEEDEEEAAEQPEECPTSRRRRLRREARAARRHARKARSVKAARA